MAMHINANVGEWYKSVEGRAFEVVAIDDDAGTVEIQYYDGDLEELDADTWYDVVLEPVAPPEDWGGAFGDLEPDNPGDIEGTLDTGDWSASLDDLESED